MYPHRIRLRAPWQCEALEEGCLCWRRRFGYPGRIDDCERVWLTFTGVADSAVIRLNDQLLGSATGGDFEFEITPLLRLRNEVMVETTASEGVPWGEVALEVRRTAWLRAVEVACVRQGERARLHVSGEAAGSAERPLELYVILDRSNVAYGLVEATPAGTAFNLSSEDLAIERCEPAGSHGVRVDLVDGATVWYTVERIL